MCGRAAPEIKLAKDHIVPIALGGTDDSDTIQPLCQRCNSSKQDTILDVRPDWEELVPRRKAPSAAPQSPAPPPAAVSRRYRVVSGGIATPGGTVWQHAIVTADQIGDADRVARLVASGSLVEVEDAD